MKADTPRIDKPQLTTQLNAAYSVDLTGLRFLPVGGEGYSYLAETTGGARFFVKAYLASDARHAETLERAFHLTAWLRDARRCRFVLAPRLARNGAPCLRHDDFVVAVFDYVDGDGRSSERRGVAAPGIPPGRTASERRRPPARAVDCV